MLLLLLLSLSRVLTLHWHLLLLLLLLRVLLAKPLTSCQHVWWNHRREGASLASLGHNVGVVWRLTSAWVDLGGLARVVWAMGGGERGGGSGGSLP
jgi:hypothetical protein